MAIRRGVNLPLSLLIIIVISLGCCSAIRLNKGNSYAKFPNWNACVNASFSFEFKTEKDNHEGLLMYIDDGGRYDFIEVMHMKGRVRVVLNIVDGKDGNIEIEGGTNVDDGSWHRVNISRNRMETSLSVDSETPKAGWSFGSDFHFGNQENNSVVYMGGLPANLIRRLHSLALPSALFQDRFKGWIRNVLYSNCSCETVRGTFMGGVGVERIPKEECEKANPCPEGCVCVSTDTEATCDCSKLTCVTETPGIYPFHDWFTVFNIRYNCQR